MIQYKKYEIDENGDRFLMKTEIPFLNTKSLILLEKNIGNIPDGLKDRFKEFNINVTRFFHCTDKQNCDHIRDYNNHSAMNKEQSGMTKITSTYRSKNQGYFRK